MYNSLPFKVYKQFKIQVDQVKDQAENTGKQIAAEQFKNAVDHLGNEKQAVVLGGVHALHNLATTFPKQYSKQVFEVLCSFIREETRKPEYQKNVLVEIEPPDKKEVSSDDKPDEKPAVSTNPPKQTTSLIVIQTIVDKLFWEKKFEFDEIDKIDEETGKKLMVYRQYRPNLSGAFLRGVNFERAYLKLTRLNYANLQGADLSFANLQSAGLWNVNLQGAKLICADLPGAALINTELQGAKLESANLQGAWLHDANLQGADLYRTDMRRAELLGTKLQGAFLHDAKLQGIWMLNGADFRGVQRQWGYREIIKEAVKNNTDLKTDLSGITLYDKEGNKLDLDEDGKKEWFRERGANVDDLPAEEVQKLFKDWK